MRHQVAGVKLNRSPAHRRALFRNLVTALLEHEAIRTTDAKAKEVKRWADRMITLGKQGTLHARRRAAAVIRSRPIVKKLFDELAPRYAARQGGYTRVVKLGVRPGDAAEIALVELVDRKGTEAQAGGRRRSRRAGGRRRRTTTGTTIRRASARRAADRVGAGSAGHPGCGRVVARGRPQDGDRGRRARTVRSRADRGRPARGSVVG